MKQLIDSFAALRTKKIYTGPDISELDEVGRQLYFKACDLATRLCLNGESFRLINNDRQAFCTLVHAERYLADRLAYELYPWPKGMLRNEEEDAYALRSKEATDGE